MQFNFALKSYVKTALASLGLFLLALLLALLAPYWSSRVVGLFVSTLSAFVAVAAAALACASAIVLVRYQRAARGARDLFLELNRSREPAAVEAAGNARVSCLRRWLARRLLGHDFVVGDLVEVKTWDEIRSTLDERGCLEELPFMPEMLAMCGRRAHVFRCVHRLFDYRKSRRMRHMNGTVLLVGTVCDGSSHGGCEAACHTIWKSAWLRRVDASGTEEEKPATTNHSEPGTGAAILQCGTQGPRYTCQLTQLHAASHPSEGRSLRNFLRPLISGNVAPAAFIVGWLTHLFNELQELRRGVEFPAFETAAACEDGTREDAQLRPGDHVIVRPPAEIRATLNDQLMHRGLWFEPDMLKHCGHRCRVRAEVRKLIDIVTGEVRTMKTPAYILQDVHFSGERQLFNAQYEPLFWRSAWLQRIDG